MAVSSGLEIQPEGTGTAGEHVGPFLHPGKELRAQRGWGTPRCHQVSWQQGELRCPGPRALCKVRCADTTVGTGGSKVLKYDGNGCMR